MAKGGYTTRKATFKQIDSAIGNLETAMYHLNNVKNTYEGHSSHVADLAEGIMRHILIGQQHLQTLRKSF